ncbi:RNA polymerase sigma factor [Streptomyces virginiae]|uniref:RNA polymerase sigma factor n=1 Tax=Streptomyces virginiae TaxID=1961 RepID=UPI0030E06AEC
MTTQTTHARRSEATDGELADRAAQGDHQAFAELVIRHQPRLLAVCRRITRDEDDARDALQNTLIHAWRGIGGYGRRSSPGTWLCRVAINSALDEVRGRGRRPSPVPELPEPAGAVAAEDPMTARVALVWAMGQLPSRTRETVLLRDHYGLSYQEIADRQHTTTDAVRSCLARGRRTLAGLLDAPRRPRGRGARERSRP